VLGAAAVPSDDAFGRFLSVVMDEHEALVEIFHHLIEALRARLPGLGNKLAVDSKAIRSYGRPVRDEEKKQQDDRRRDVDANWGTKTYKGLRADGSLFADCVDPFIYDEHGQLYCVCPETGEQRELTFCGYEADRRTLKYRCPLRGLQKTLPSSRTAKDAALFEDCKRRCPAAANGFECKGRASCEAMANVGVFGRVIRVPLEKDRRIFTPIARHTAKWKTAYARRSSVERVNSRLDCVLGFEQHTIRGLKKMTTRVSLALIVLLAMALGRVMADQAELMRSLTAPVKRAA